MAKNTTYKASFDLKLGDQDANKTFVVYVAKENGDPRFGTAMKTLELNFDDIKNFVTNNTDDFASVTYNGETQLAHIELLFTTDETVNTQLVSCCSGQNNWLLDNVSFKQVILTDSLSQGGSR